MSNQKIPKVRELAFKKLNKNIEEVEKPKKKQNYHAKSVLDPLESIAEHRKVRELIEKRTFQKLRSWKL